MTSTMSRQVTGSSEDTDDEESVMKCLDELPGLREIDAALDEVSPPLATHATEYGATKATCTVKRGNALALCMIITGGQ